MHTGKSVFHLLDSSGNQAEQQNITAKIGLILSFSLVLIWGARLPVVRIGRIAGQYAKPRSSGFENIGGRQVLSFRYFGFFVENDPLILSQ